MYQFFQFFTQEFGFNSISQFFNSLFRPNFFYVSIPVTIIGSFVQYVFGIDAIVLIAFVALLTLELTSGIFASWMENTPITSKRMKAFLMMLFVWLVVLFILNTFAKHFKGTVGQFVFSYLFNAVLIFVNVIYFKSIWENVGRIMGKKKECKKFADFFTKRLDNVD